MRPRWACLVGACACSIACEGATSRDLEPIPRDEYMAAYIRAFCESELRCCGADAHSDLDTCILTWGQGGSDHLGLNGAVSYDPLAAAACVDATRRRKCVWPPEVPICGSVIAGTLAEGDSCVATSECAQVIGRELACRDGVCANVRRKLGEPCSQTCMEQTMLVSCGTHTVLGNCYTKDGLYCRVADSVCAQLIAPGQPCDDYASCGDEYDAACSSGVCEKVPKLGEACTQKGGICNKGAYCDGHSCQLKKVMGAACELSWDCQDGACRDGRCTTPEYVCY